MRACRDARKGVRACRDARKGVRACRDARKGVRACRDARKGVRACRDARKGVRTAKNTWFQMREEWGEVSLEEHQRRTTWEKRTCSKAVLRDEAGAACGTSEMQHQRWRRHFCQILNIKSEYDKEELAMV